MNYSTQQQSGCKRSMCSTCGMCKNITGMPMETPMDMSLMDMPLMPNNGMNRPAADFDQFPLAMAYVPWQCWNQVYDLEEGFEAGTIFPELNLPFTGRCMTNAR